MNILQKYVAKSYISAFFLGMVVLTFVLSIGLLVKATQLVIKGLDPKLILNFLLVSIPESFSFTIPLAVLVSALLVFGRLSTDGEMSAMKACGINLWSVMFPLIIFGVALTGLSVYVNSEVAPRGYYARHLISSSAKGTSALKLLEPGHFIEEFPGMTFWFAKKNGDVLENVLIYDKSKPGFTREIRAEKALVTVTGNDIALDMYKVRIEPFSDTQPGAATAGRLQHTIKDAVVQKEYRPKVGANLNGALMAGITNLDEQIITAVPVLEEREANARNAAAELEKHAAELLRAENNLAAVSNNLARGGLELGALLADPAYTNALASCEEARTGHEDLKLTSLRTAQILETGRSAYADNVKKRSEMKTELNRRFALGVAPIIFLLIGMPLGIRTSRRESNIGVAISMSVMIIYYAFMIMAKSLAKRPECFPHIIIWIPSVVCLVIAVMLIRRNQ